VKKGEIEIEEDLFYCYLILLLVIIVFIYLLCYLSYYLLSYLFVLLFIYLLYYLYYLLVSDGKDVRDSHGHQLKSISPADEEKDDIWSTGVKAQMAQRQLISGRR